MSNHGGSFMLNYILHLLEARNFFAHLSKKEKFELFDKIIRLDAVFTNGEILDETGMEQGVCSGCRNYAKIMNEDGLCSECLGDAT